MAVEQAFKLCVPPCYQKQHIFVLFDNFRCGVCAGRPEYGNPNGMGELLDVRFAKHV
jgi:hypothetical protein